MDQRVVLNLGDLVVLEDLVEPLSFVLLLPDQGLVLQLCQLDVRLNLPDLGLELIDVVLFLNDVVFKGLNLYPLLPDLICGCFQFAL